MIYILFFQDVEVLFSFYQVTLCNLPFKELLLQARFPLFYSKQFDLIKCPSCRFQWKLKRARQFFLFFPGRWRKKSSRMEAEFQRGAERRLCDELRWTIHAPQIVTLRLNSRSELSIKRTFSIRNLSEEREHTKTDIVVGRINHSGPFLRELYLYSVHTVCRCAAEVGTALKMNKELPYLFLILDPLFVRRWKSRHWGGGGEGWGDTKWEKKSVIVYYHKKDGGEHPVIFVRNSLPLPPPENAFLEIKLSLKD